MNDTVNDTAAALRDGHRRIREERGLRQRDVAVALGVAEGELIAAYAGLNVTRLRPEFAAIMESVPTLGRVMALTRNEVVVHERHGVYEKISHNGGMGIALGKDIDLRIFYSQWASAFAVTDSSPRGELKSLQFYDAHGEAVHKVYLTAHSDAAAYDALVQSYRADDQTPGLHGTSAVTPVPALPVEKPDAEIDVAGFQAGWSAMTDTHEFFGLLKRFGVTRTQALRLAPAGMVTPVVIETLTAVLNDAAATALPIMVFVGNRGMIQIHTGPVVKIAPMDHWLNVLDPDFNMHLRRDLVASAFIVRKPTADGVVTSLELFDAQGVNVAMLFGARKPGQPELTGWRETLARASDPGAIGDAGGAVAGKMPGTIEGVV
jgi:putative hemin transport protein